MIGLAEWRQRKGLGRMKTFPGERLVSGEQGQAVEGGVNG